MKNFLALLLCASSALAGLNYEFSTNNLIGLPLGVRFYWDFQQYTPSGTNAIRVVNAPPAFAETNISFTKMSNGLVMPLTATESNLVLTLTTSNATWQAFSAMTNEIRSAEAVYQQSNFLALVIKANSLLTIDRMNLWRPAGSNAITTNGYLILLTNTIRSLRGAP